MPLRHAGSNEIGSLAIDVAPFQKELSCLEVCDFFSKNPDVLTVAVVDNARPIGLINRDSFLLLFSGQFGHALFDKRSIVYAMDTNPFIVDKACSIALAASLILNENPHALLKGFIITDEERYFGVGTAFGLLSYSVARGREREQELDTARNEAVLANETKTLFLANMSHELRTPLNAIIGFSEIMSEELFGAIGNERYRDYAGDIYRSGMHLLGLVNDVLDVARIESGQMKLDERNGDFNEIIQNCLTQVSAQANNAGVALVNSAASELPELYMDDRKLRQVLINLLSNAIKFTPEGGQVCVHASMTADHTLNVTVTDTGIGIAPEDIPRVLQKFGQVDNSLQRKFDGVGLGLPLSKSLIELHGGSLWIESSPGKGAAVSFTLPASRLVQPRLLHAVSA
ncbi:MAG: ATP-binding protein [Alphaproteobacteria bacterium]